MNLYKNVSAERRQHAMNEMHQKHVTAEMSIHRLNQLNEQHVITKDMLREELDNAFMTGNTDEEIEEIKLKINEVEQKEQNTSQEL